MPARTLYAAQQATIVTNANTTGNFAVQSASAETSIPVDDLLILGKFGSAGRHQKEVATCKSDLKIFLAMDTGNAAALNGSFLAELTGETVEGKVSTITVAPNGFTMSGIVSSIGIDHSQGNYAMCDLSFVGVGEPDYAAVPTTVGGAGGSPADAISITPITTGIEIYDTAGALTTACPASAKFSLDIPNEVISCLGGQISGRQEDVASANVQVGKPPFKGSITVEGTSAEEVNKLKFSALGAGISCVINDGKLISRSFNQNAGDVGANYSFTLEGVDVDIT
jgi:hypothetical protein